MLANRRSERIDNRLRTMDGSRRTCSVRALVNSTNLQPCQLVTLQTELCEVSRNLPVLQFKTASHCLSEQFVASTGPIYKESYDLS